MLTSNEIFWFALAALVLGLTPGPNMAYCLSRTLCQGRVAGLVSLAGILTAYGVHVMATALGLSAVLLAFPATFDAIKFAGAAYMLYLAWLVLRPGAAASLALRRLKPARTSALFCMGFFINLLNPKAVLFYVALLPQFLRPDRIDADGHGTLLFQSLQLGAVQVTMSGLVMGLLVCAVSRLQPVLDLHRGIWQSVTRYLMGGVFAALALGCSPCEWGNFKILLNR